MFKYARGCWKLFREIRSLVDEHYIAVVNEGVASFHPWQGAVEDGEQTIKSQCLLYRESGKLENYDFPAASGQFTRQYLYKFPLEDSDSSNNIKVYHCSKKSMSHKDTDPLNSHFEPMSFKEDDFFHDLVFPENVDWSSLSESTSREPLTAVGQHLCGRDVYKGVFQIYSLDNFKTIWKVTGPEKAFQIVSIYTRLPV